MSARRIPRRVVVRGFAPFPIDMLRYDGLIPDSSEDSAVIERLMRGEVSESVDVRLLALDASFGATLPRWQSFGWHVIEGAK